MPCSPACMSLLRATRAVPHPHAHPPAPAPTPPHPTLSPPVCAVFSITWIEVSGQSANDVAKQLRDQQYFLAVSAPSRQLPPAQPSCMCLVAAPKGDPAGHVALGRMLKRSSQ